MILSALQTLPETTEIGRSKNRWEVFMGEMNRKGKPLSGGTISSGSNRKEMRYFRKKAPIIHHAMTCPQPERYQHRLNKIPLKRFAAPP